MRNRTGPKLLMAAWLLGCSASGAWAGDVVWNGPGGGNFNTGANWTPAAVPGPDDTAVFTNLSASQVISLSAGVTNAGVRFGGLIPQWTPNLGTGPYRWYVTNDFLVATDTNTTGVPSLNDGTIIITNAAGTAQLRIAPEGYYGAFWINGGTVTVDNIVATNPASTPNLWLNKGSLTTLRSTLISRPSDLQINPAAPGFAMDWIMPSGTHTVLAVNGTSIAQTGGGSTARVYVAGAATVWSNSGAVSVGANGVGLLRISNGAKVYSTGSQIGATTAGRGDALITDPASTWEIVGDSRYFYIPGSSSGGSIGYNSLVVSNGGTLRMKGSSCAFTIGAGSSNHDSEVILTGSNSVMDLGSNGVIVGYARGHHLSVLDGGQFLAGTLNLGWGATATNCTVVVDGVGTVLSLTNELGAGANAALSQMTISGGARVYSGGTAGSVGGGGNSNLLTVTGNGSIWSNRSALYVGNSGNRNTLVVTNGGLVYCGEVRLGAGVTYRGNRLIVTGTNSALLCNTSDFYVARQAVYENELIIRDGGRIEDVTGYLGLWSCVSNHALITGAGSTWSNSSGLHVGSQSALSFLTIKDGGKVYSTLGNVGQYTGADSNRVTVDGPGAEWISSSTFTIGGNGGVGGAWNEMIITNGGRVCTTAGQYIAVGNAVSSSWNKVVITGPGSEWNALGSYIRIGAAGVSNEMRISDGALVQASGFYIGAAAGPGTRVYISAGGTIDGGDFQNLGTSDARMENDGGIYQFSVAPPTFNPYASGVYSIVNGTVSFRRVTAASISPIGNLTYTGTNSFRLNHATNSSATDQSYVFNTGLGASHYAGLDMINGTTRYRSSTPASHTLSIGSNGSMLCSNTAATVDLAFQNDGMLRVVNSTLTFVRTATFNGTNVISLNSLANPDCVVTGVDMSFGGTLVLEGLGPLTNRNETVTVFAYTSRSGEFQIEGLPARYRINYGPTSAWLGWNQGTVFVIH